LTLMMPHYYWHIDIIDISLRLRHAIIDILYYYITLMTLL
jgi:hypothetical protein